MKKVILLFLLSVLILLFFLPQEHKLSYSTVETIANIKLNGINFIQYLKIKRNIKLICTEFEKKYSMDDVSGFFYILNTEKMIPINTEDHDLILKGIEMSKFTNGIFDISVQPILKSWGFYSGDYNIPNTEELNELLKDVDYKQIILDDDELKIGKDQEINCGAYLKGYLVDKIYNYLIKKKVPEFIVEIGGDLRVFSKKGKIFRVGIKHPRESGLIKIIELKSSKAIATSGDYERSFKIDGVRYHHLISAKSGLPCGYYTSVTVISDKCVDADLLSSVFFLLDEKRINENKKKFPFIKAYLFNDSLGEIVVQK